MEAVSQSVNYGMNTVMTHKAYGKHAEASLKAVRSEAARLERLLSRFLPESVISRINQSAGKNSVRMSDEAYEVLSHAVEFSRCSGGLFDITIGPLVTLWNNCREISSPPDEFRINEILPLINYEDLILNPSTKSIGLKAAGQSIDLGGIGKGYAGDKIKEIFESYGITSAYTNLGGNVVALGEKPDGSPWRVGIQHPRQENSIIGLVSVTDKAVVTSGDYERYFMDGNGKRYHHILDPSTGYPAESGLVSVTIVADNSMDADALSTVMFIAGMEKGLGILKRFSGVEAIFIDIDLRVHVTPGLKDCFLTHEGINTEILNG